MSQWLPLHRKNFYTRFLAAVLALLLLFSGCSAAPGPAVPYERHIASAGESPAEHGPGTHTEAPDSAHTESGPAASAPNPEFTKLTADLFKKWVTEISISLHYTLKNPAVAGITDSPVTFGNYAVEQFKEDLVDLKDARARLHAIDYGSLSADQQLSWRILEAYIGAELSFEGLELYAQPLSPTIGIQAQLPVLLAEYDFNTAQDVEDYLNLLSQIDGYFGQLLNFEREKADAGLFMSDWMADEVIASCESYLTAPEESFLCQTFSGRLDECEAAVGFTAAQRADWEARNLAALTEHFLPAYELLIQGLENLKGSGTNDGSLCHFPDGKAYYEYLVDSGIGPSYGSVESLRRAVAAQLTADLLAIQEMVAKDPQIVDRLETASFTVLTPEAMLESLRENAKAGFPGLPDLTCTVKQVPDSLASSLSPAFYLTPAIDQYADHTIYINPRYADSDLYPTMAHEGYPGHLYQSAYFFGLGVCNLRYLLSFSSYSEGWATYVEHLSYGFDNGLDEDCAKLLAHNSLANLGMYALLDINVNYYGWDEEKTAGFLKSFGIDDRETARQVFRALAANPVNYLQYYAGCMEFLDMRAQAEDALGEEFSEKEFHRMLLDVGPAPFTVVREEFEKWLGQ